MISSLLHLVGLRPRVYYTLINFGGEGGKALWAPPSIRQCKLMPIYHILHKNSIGHLLRTSQDYFRPPPPRFREEMDSIYVHFRRVFVEFVVLLTKIWHTNIDF